MIDNITGKTIVITGASSGMGAAAARHLAEKGAAVVLGARRSDRIDSLAAEIIAAGGNAIAVGTDVTKRDDLQRLVDAAVDTYGRIDVLINNAGVMPLSPLERLKVEEWDRMIDVNLKGVLYGVAAALPHMIAQRSGHIINVSSVAGHKLFGGSAVIFRHQVRGARPVGGAAPGDGSAQHPHHDYLAGRGQDRTSRPHQRGGRPEGQSGLRRPDRRPCRNAGAPGRLRHQRTRGCRNQRDPLPTDRSGTLCLATGRAGQSPDPLATPLVRRAPEGNEGSRLRWRPASRKRQTRRKRTSFAARTPDLPEAG